MWTSSTSFRRVRYPALRGAPAYTRTRMADKPPKPRTHAKRAPHGVLGTLPATRPERIGRPRAGTGTDAAVKPPARKAPAAKAAPKPAARVTQAAHGPVAVTPGCPPLPVTHSADAPPPEPIGGPTGTELVTTTIRAAGELAQIGFVVGSQVLKRTIDRLPRP